jgi:hypothetical protein
MAKHKKCKKLTVKLFRINRKNKDGPLVAYRGKVCERNTERKCVRNKKGRILYCRRSYKKK